MEEIVLIEDGKLAEKVVVEIATIEGMIAGLKEKQEQYKKTLRDLMEEKSVKSIENDLFKIVLIPENEKVSIDTDKLKKDHEGVYLECLKKSKIKSFVKITLK